MGFAHIKHDLQILVHRGGVLIGNPGDKTVVPGIQVEKNLGAHRLHHIYRGCDCKLRPGVLRENLVINIFRANSKNHVLFTVRLDLGMVLRKKAQLDSLVGKEKIAVLSHNSSVQKIHGHA